VSGSTLEMTRNAEVSDATFASVRKALAYDQVVVERSA
jgi:hypothetical protein